MDTCMGTKGPRAVLLQNRRSSARTARGGLEFAEWVGVSNLK